MIISHFLLLLHGKKRLKVYIFFHERHHSALFYNYFLLAAANWWPLYGPLMNGCPSSHFLAMHLHLSKETAKVFFHSKISSGAHNGPILLLPALIAIFIPRITFTYLLYLTLCCISVTIVYIWLKFIKRTHSTKG